MEFFSQDLLCMIYQNVVEEVHFVVPQWYESMGQMFPEFSAKNFVSENDINMLSNLDTMNCIVSWFCLFWFIYMFWLPRNSEPNANFL